MGNIMLERRKEIADEAPQRSYEDVKARSASAADRIEQATAELINTFRELNEKTTKAA